MRTIFAAALAALAGCAPSKAPADNAPHAGILVTGGAIVDPVSGSVGAPMDILVEDGVIVAVEAAGALDKARAASVMEADGLFLLPGLIDAHAHIGDGGVTAQTEEDRIAALEQFVRYGVTTIFVPGGTGGNDEDLADWKRRCGGGETSCPRVFGSGDLITAPDSHPINTIMSFPPGAGQAEFHRRGVMTIAEDEPAEPVIAAKAAAGVDAVKIVIEDGPGPWSPRPRLSNDKVKEIVEASHARGLKVFAHVSLAGHLVDGVTAGVDGFMHSVDDPIPEETLSAMADRGVFYIATLSLFDGLVDEELGRFKEEPYALKGASPKALDSLRSAARTPRATPEDTDAWMRGLNANLLSVRDAGAPLALGTDVNNPTVFPGYSAHEELELMVRAGLTPAEALAAATVGGATFLGRKGELGRIAEGFRGDMIAMRANPLDDILNTRTLDFVMLGGAVRRDVVSMDRD